VPIREFNQQVSDTVRVCIKSPPKRNYNNGNLGSLSVLLMSKDTRIGSLTGHRKNTLLQC
jgi:hypothetical protein